MYKKQIATDKKVITFGEVMLRLTAPDFLLFSQTNQMIATYGGSEANVAVSLANFGIPTEFVTRLPDNAVARACIASLRANGLGTDFIFWKVVRHSVIPMWFTTVRVLLLPHCVQV